MQAVALRTNALSVQLDSRRVLEGLNLDLLAGQWTAVVGPNGAGKSTLLKCLAGLLPYYGQVLLHGQDIAQLPARQRAQQLAWLGQHETGADDLTAYDVAMLGRLPHQGWLSAPSAADHHAVEQALRMTQGWDWRARPLGQLSSGERQRVLLARLLAVQASVLLMDEPLANLDPPHQTDWLQAVRGLVAQGTTVVSVLHEVSMALQADQLLIMVPGSIAHQGACDEAATHRALEAVFDQRISVQAVGDIYMAIPQLTGFSPSNVQSP
jgi:iron complex transport system ATP-binding protein